MQERLRNAHCETDNGIIAKSSGEILKLLALIFIAFNINEINAQERLSIRNILEPCIR